MNVLFVYLILLRVSFMVKLELFMKFRFNLLGNIYFRNIFK